ncbi:MAG: VanW family protein, partial [Armatimonadetes bacterium]|nr:VanW family protein [Armatimonadota bacterium]
MKRNPVLFLAVSTALAPCLYAFAQDETPAKPEPSPQASATPKPDAPKSVADTKNRLDLPITFTDGVSFVTRTRKELGLSLVSDAPVRFVVDKARLKDALGAVAKTFRSEAVDFRPAISGGKFAIKPGQSARALNVATTAERFEDAVTENPGTVSFRVSLDKKPPVVTADKLTGITGKMSSFSSVASDTAGRDINIGIAVGDINGTLLSPEETFSLNTIVGRRTKARGYKKAKVFVNAKIVEGVGGGVSQVTGTLFNAAALAGLSILEVHPHSRPVAYLPLGRDATVAYGSKDLRFKNNTDAPVYIVYTFQRQRLTATVWGKPVAGRKIALRPRVQRRGA